MQIIVGGDDITALVDSVFGNLREGIWWRVLPIEGANDDICSGTGQAWDVLLPLLLERAIIRVHGKPTLSGYQFRKWSWETLCTTFRGEGQLQMGTLQTKKVERLGMLPGEAWFSTIQSYRMMRIRMETSHTVKVIIPLMWAVMTLVSGQAWRAH
jgi:hypothetical protein